MGQITGYRQYTLFVRDGTPYGDSMPYEDDFAPKETFILAGTFAAGICDHITLDSQRKCLACFEQHSEDLEFIELSCHIVQYGNLDET